MRAQTVSPSKITVLDFVIRPENRVDDDATRRSIEQGGIQQPLVVVQDGDRLLLADGLRRLRIAGHLALAKVPVVVDDVPSGEQPEAYVRRLRFILDHHRQDLLPTQKAEMVLTLEERFKMKKQEIAAYLGVDPDSITNWVAVASYIEPVRRALDAGTLPMRGARVFSGLTPEGQKAIWSKHEKELLTVSGTQTHKEMRALYPPSKYPQYYVDAKMVTERLARTKKLRAGKSRPALSTDEKARLINSYEVKEQDLIDLQAEQRQMKKEINAAIPIIAAIHRNEKLWALVPEETKPEFERFVELYC